MSQLNDAVLKVRAKLREMGIRLWEEPYYIEDIGAVEDELNKLADEYSKVLSITQSMCKLALAELQDKAVRKLASNKEFTSTGNATFNLRQINKSGTLSMISVQCNIHSLGSELLENIGKALNLQNIHQIKCIAAGKIIDKNRTLNNQGLTNNQHLLVIANEVGGNGPGCSKDAMYDRVYKIKRDVELLADSKRQMFEMEDQAGNPVFLPPEENRAIVLGMGLGEKARAALKREDYDEALLLLLEADEQFSSCNSKFLEGVDNYALLNLDIVWCYFCLKNVTQLPDAERRLNSCEEILSRNYGRNFSRVIELKGNACAEKALMMRLHLLQGVVHFHQNQRDAAYNKLYEASVELTELKVDEDQIATLVEMGYDQAESLVALRCCSGNLERAINFIHEQRDKLETNRRRNEKARKLNRHLKPSKEDKDWVNPQSVVQLMEMGFSRDVVIVALKEAKNNLTKALDLLQYNQEELQRNVQPTVSPDDDLFNQLKILGFDEEMIRLALETTNNDLDKSVDFLMKMFKDEDDLLKTVEGISQRLDTESSNAFPANTVFNLAQHVMDRAASELESLKALKRFNEDIDENEYNHLDLPLIREEQILAEYMNLLEK